MKIYLVGGAVRDKLLGLPLKERDYVVVGASPEEMLKLGFRPVGQDFPVFLHPKTQEEYALARTERKVAKGYGGFSFYTDPSVTLEEDLKRRDLTINAMAMTENGELIDPYGGKQDLEKKVLRHVSPAFKEDPVRILRVARFLARFSPLGFTVDNDTVVLMREMVTNGEVNALTKERVWQELKRALGEKAPQKFIETLRAVDALKIIFPEINNLYGVPQPPHWHPEIDTGIHIQLVLEQAALLSSSTEILFAALLHDLGKGITPKEIWPRHTEHEEKGVPLVKALCKRLSVPKNYADIAVIVCLYHGLCHRALELQPSTLLDLLEKIDAFRRPTRLQQFLLACEADARGRTGLENDPYPQSHFIQKVFTSASLVPIQPLIAKGYAGLNLKEELRKARIENIKKLIKEK